MSNHHNPLLVFPAPPATRNSYQKMRPEEEDAPTPRRAETPSHQNAQMPDSAPHHPHLSGPFACGQSTAPPWNAAVYFLPLPRPTPRRAEPPSRQNDLKPGSVPNRPHPSGPFVCGQSIQHASGALPLASKTSEFPRHLLVKQDRVPRRNMGAAKFRVARHLLQGRRQRHPP